MGLFGKKKEDSNKPPLRNVIGSKGKGGWLGKKDKGNQQGKKIKGIDNLGNS